MLKNVLLWILGWKYWREILLYSLRHLLCFCSCVCKPDVAFVASLWLRCWRQFSVYSWFMFRSVSAMVDSCSWGCDPVSGMLLAPSIHQRMKVEVWNLSSDSRVWLCWLILVFNPAFFSFLGGGIRSPSPRILLLWCHLRLVSGFLLVYGSGLWLSSSQRSVSDDSEQDERLQHRGRTRAGTFRPLFNLSFRLHPLKSADRLLNRPLLLGLLKSVEFAADDRRFSFISVDSKRQMKVRIWDRNLLKNEALFWEMIVQLLY